MLAAHEGTDIDSSAVPSCVARACWQSRVEPPSARGNPCHPSPRWPHRRRSSARARPLPHAPHSGQLAARDRRAVAVAVAADLPLRRVQRNVWQRRNAVLKAAVGIVRVAGLWDSRVASPTKRYTPGVTPRKKQALRTCSASPAPTPAVSMKMSAETSTSAKKKSPMMLSGWSPRLQIGRPQRQLPPRDVAGARRPQGRSRTAHLIAEVGPWPDEHSVKVLLIW